MEEKNNVEQENQNNFSKKKRLSKGIVATLSLAAIVLGATAFALFGGIIYDSQEKNPPHIHTFGDWNIVKESTCVAEGEQERFCPCGEKQKNIIPTKEHSYLGEPTITKHPTCTEEGSRSQECSYCNSITYTPIPKADHTYKSSTITKPATCKETGEKTAQCANCSQKIVESIPKTNDHAPIIDDAVQATCTATGLSQGSHCRVCNQVLTEQSVTPMVPHNLTETITKKATSTQSGTKMFSCTNCSYSKTESYSLKPLTSEEIYSVAEKSVGEIKTYRKSGSGLALGTAFVYSADGTVVTNYHVIEGAYSANVTINGQTYAIDKVLTYDKDIDIAILKINATGLVPLYTQTEDIKGGATVYAVGSSEGYTLSFSTGVIASPSRIFNGVEYIQHEAAISHGNSGGPLFNIYGEVIGINTLSNINGQNLNFAISCSELDNLSYGTALSMSELYEKECNPFSILKDYIIENGTYDSEDNEYRLMYKTSYSSDYTTKYIHYIDYIVDDDELKLTLFLDGSTDCMVSFTVGSGVSGYYEWFYIDDYDYYMTGTITARTYTDNTLLGYSYHNLNYSSIRDSIRKLASNMIDLVLTGFDVYLYPETGVAISDLGFVSY
ncbi:MAG: trypsin-like peptidase domain-containing protein [Clostridia bacterium]|nr:trypsin-like peptidase domain-containing protein [Clostridia bacterium]